jgi:hypothetical protein
MRVWDAKTQSLTPEYLAHSKLAKALCIGDVMIMGAGPAVVTSLRRTAEGWIEIKVEFLELDEDDGGSGCFMSNPEGRWMVRPA